MTSQDRSDKMFSPKILRFYYYSERLIEILKKIHYTTEAMLNLVITYIKILEGRFILTIYIPFYLMEFTCSIRKTSSENISNWFDLWGLEYI